ncbi:DUF4062 domain-containing protein [uncultured Rubinisphaera sp.]|uniref:DUF4062 domain-containing protein n=1 Tax=uncultured Rubinisphaera sp. TaxID=1678686 RepID=UPI0030DDA38E
MAGDWRTIRVFISSTFRDMHSERDWLVKRVFPALRERLEQYRVHLVDIDLRWGITEDQAKNDEVLDLCLNQIDECRPFFLGLLGERYGWVPEGLPDPSSKNGWTQHHTGKSVTELEIRWGVLMEKAMHDHAMFLFRDPAFAQDVPEAMRHEVEVENPESEAHLKRLKDEIRNAQRQFPVIKNYPCEYAGLRLNWGLAKFDLNDQQIAMLEPLAEDGIVDNNEYATLNEELREVVHHYSTVALVGLEEFGTQIQTWLWTAICTKLNLEDSPDEAEEVDSLTQELGFHKRFMESRLRVYVGRRSLQQQLIEFVKSDSEKPALLTGPSGSGKSAALAKFVTEYEKKCPETLVLPHFVGASPNSTGLRQMLYRFSSELKNKFNLEDEVPPDTNSLITTFRQFVTQVPQGGNVLLVIDALNQLDESDYAQQMNWLPMQFPSQFKVVVSCIDDPGREEAVLTAFRNRETHRIEVPVLTNEERFDIVKEVPSISAKALNSKQVELLLQNKATTNPLYLLVALEELRGFGSFEQLNRRISRFPQGSDPVTELFVQVIHRMQAEFDELTVYEVLSLLACARRGLSDRELLDIIEGSSVAINKSESDLFPILRQLRPYMQHRGELRDFFHRNLYKAVEQEFLPDSTSKSAAHANLAEYFERQDYFSESLGEQRARAKRLPPSARPVNIRKVDELPHQFLQVAKLSGKDDPKSPHWDKVADLFTELQFLEAKAEADPEGKA